MATVWQSRPRIVSKTVSLGVDAKGNKHRARLAPPMAWMASATALHVALAAHQERVAPQTATSSVA